MSLAAFKSHRLPYSESSASTSGDEAESGGEGGGAGGAGTELGAAVGVSAAEGGSLDEGSGRAKTAVGTHGEPEATSPDTVSEFLATSSGRRHCFS